jgi:hypothetical protein
MEKFVRCERICVCIHPIYNPHTLSLAVLCVIYKLSPPTHRIVAEASQESHQLTDKQEWCRNRLTDGVVPET